MAKSSLDLEKEKEKMASSSSSSKSSKSSKPDRSNYPKAGPTPVLVDSTARSQLGGPEVAAMEGHFAVVTGGEHEGRYGVFESVVEVDDKGLPEKVSFRTRDDDSEYLVVDYDDLKPAAAGRR